MQKHFIRAFSIAFFIVSIRDFHGPSDLPLLQNADPVLIAAGDIAFCTSDRDEATAGLIDNIPGMIATLGDNAYDDGTLEEFMNCYEPSWGRHRSRTRPAPGNNDYGTEGAAGYFTYFGEAASPLEPGCLHDCLGFYSYDLGAWHIIVLNSEIPFQPGSPQDQWLRQDLASHPSACTLAYWHRPLFSSGEQVKNEALRSLWQSLHEHGADVVLNGHDHFYERFAPQDPNGSPDPVHGIRQFTVGTGGGMPHGLSLFKANSEASSNDSPGVLKLTLRPTGYNWEFIPIPGKTFRDTGSAECIQPAGGSGAAVGSQLPISSPHLEGLIFADGFESGNDSLWSVNHLVEGDMEINSLAALHGSLGLQINVNDSNPNFVMDDQPASETKYRARFYFDPNSIWMRPGDEHTIFSGIMSWDKQVLRIDLRRGSESYELRVSTLTDFIFWRRSRWYAISDEPHYLELEWHASSRRWANDGLVAWWIDGVIREIITGIDNDTRRIDRAQLGAVGGIDMGTRGSYYFDAFESRRDGYIGP